MHTISNYSKKSIWAGRVISGLCIIFLLFDSITKIIGFSQSVEGSIQLGWPENSLTATGIILLGCTILYIIPSTAIAGALLLTAYLGGATAIMFRAGIPGHPYFFPVVFGIAMWAGLFFRDKNLFSFILYGPARAGQ